MFPLTFGKVSGIDDGMNRRIILAAATALAALALASPAEAATSYRVTGTGDSILHLTRAAGGLTRADRWLDTEQGRDALTPGNQGRMSTTQAFAAALAVSQPNGWIIVQDNGAHATDAQWRSMLRTMVANTPNDRCLLAVLPVFHPNWSPVAAENAARKANIMVQEFNVQPCHQYVRWNQAVMANPGLVYDGQHPSSAGITWLTRTINSVVG